MIIEILTNPLGRLTLILLTTSLFILALGRAEPGWRVSLVRGTFLGILGLVAIHFSGLKWEMPVLKATHQIQSTASGNTTAPTVSIVEGGDLATASNTAAATTPVTAKPVPQQERLFQWPQALLFVWISVASVLLFRQVLLLLNHHRLVRSAPAASSEYTARWTAACRELGVSPTSVKSFKGQTSPHLHFDGTLLLPDSIQEAEVSATSLVHALRHEAAHLKSADHRWFLFSSMMTTLLWFHPLVWWLAAKHIESCEEARDAAAARIGGANSYRTSVAQLALSLVPAKLATPSLIGRRGRLVSRLSRVSRLAALRPPMKNLTVAAQALLIALSLAAGAVAPTLLAVEEKGLVGSWVAVDSDSDSTKQIDIYKWAGEMKMKIWHTVNAGEKTTQPSVIELPPEAEEIQPGGQGVEASREFGFKVVGYLLELKGKNLKLSANHSYTDDSGRGIRNHVQYFERGTYDVEPPAKAQAKPAEPQTAPEVAKVAKKNDESAIEGIGWAGNWRCIDDVGGSIAQLTIRDLGEPVVSVWSFMGATISQGPIGTATLPIPFSELASEKGPGSLEFETDSGFATAYYSLKREGDQMTLDFKHVFKDPNRAPVTDQVHLKRGTFPREAK